MQGKGVARKCQTCHSSPGHQVHHPELPPHRERHLLSGDLQSAGCKLAGGFPGALAVAGVVQGWRLGRQVDSI